MAAERLNRFFKIRWRILLATTFGVLSGVASGLAHASLATSILMGWIVGATVYLVPTWVMFLRDDEATVRERAGLDDESPVMLMLLMLCAVIASLAAIVLALHEKGHSQGGHSVAPTLMSAASLILGWLVLQSLFTTHYTHLYFGDRNDDGTADKGIDFPGDPPRTYRDFVYVAICIGATCQVSDFDITHARFRNLVTIHAALAFFFNTMVLAFGINILGSLVG